MPKILILDIETTNFLNKGGKIVEIGLVELCLETGAKKIVFDEVCHEKGITLKEVQEAWIIENSTLTVKQVRNSRSLDVIRPIVQEILDEYTEGATAFNNDFDFGFFEDRGFTFPKKLPCPMKLSTNICRIPNRNGYSGFKWPNVMEAHKHFIGDVGYIEQHRGADDAFHESDIVLELYKRGIFKLN